MTGAETDRQYAAMLEEAARFIRSRDHFLVVSHVDPDGDAAGSTCAVGCILEQCGKRFTLINDGEIPRKFSHLHGYDRVLDLKRERPQAKFRHIISVDCADFARFGAVSELFDEEYELLNIDHHSTNDRFGTVNVVKPDAAATAEILYDLIRTMGLPWTKENAECVYTGLLTDTGGFRYSNTTPKVMRIASELLEHGVEGAKLAQALLETVSYAHILLLKRALATLAFTEDRRIAWMVVEQRDLAAAGAKMSELDGLVNYPRNIEGVDIGILFKEVRENEYKISLRSGKHADVSAVAQRLGGGGHVRAAGVTVAGTREEVIARVLEAARAELT
jgi:phosphoesterase RecJ-like protein